jgi:acetyl-CoA C-acetyltransferase
VRTGTKKVVKDASSPDLQWELPFGVANVSNYALVAARHMYEFGTTSEQLAWVKVSASHHAQHNPGAVLRNVVSVEEVLASPMVSDPLHRLDCCLITDGGGAIVLARPEIAASLRRPAIRLRGAGMALKHQEAGAIDLTYSGAVQSGRMAFGEAGVTPGDMDYASIYDSFTITVVVQLEDLGFCEKGKGGAFVADGNLIANVGALPVNTDGGGLCNNHPANRGGITKLIEAIRQLRGKANPEVQVRNCNLVCVHGTGGYLGTRHGSATLILERAQS